jgi:crotonobetainyl-CoA:carnitine CoA-transferase CaiB-like acyl-CoA transferase
VGQAITGMQMSGRDTPRLARFPLCDFGAGHLLAFAVLLALWHRAQTGEGQHAESSLMQAGAYHQAIAMLDPAPANAPRLDDIGIAAAQIRTIDEAMDDSGAKARGWSRIAPYADGGEVRMIGPIPLMSATKLPPLPAGAPPGRDTRKILRRYCSDAALEKLFFDGVAAEALAPETAIVW